MKSRWILANILLIAVSITWLVPFICILRWGTHTVHEPRLPVLLLEIALIIAIIILGAYNLAKKE